MLSRYPSCPVDEELSEQDPCNHEAHAVSHSDLRDLPQVEGVQPNIHELIKDHDSAPLRELREHAARDNEYQQRVKYVINGFPLRKASLPPSLRDYWRVRHGLNFDDSLLVFVARLIIPQSLRCALLSSLVCMLPTLASRRPRRGREESYTGRP